MDKTKNICRALIFYSELVNLMNIFFSGYLITTTDEISLTYFRLCNKMGEILNQPPFEGSIFVWMPVDNLRNIDPDYPEGEWDCGGKQLCNEFLSDIEKMFVENGERQCPLDPDEAEFLRSIRESINKYKLLKNHHEKIFVQRNFSKKGTEWNDAGFWKLIQKDIVAQAKKRFEDEYYADAVESACKELIHRVKKWHKDASGEELDGKDLMFKAFHIDKSNPDPVIRLDDLSTENGINIQDGYMHLFAGTVSGIRNPKAHNNIEISPERAIHLIFLISLLMHKLDEAEQSKLVH
jgi:uncharacterized protein (TIGR02391 family)